MPLAIACAAAGHQTVIAVGPPFVGRLPLPTVEGYPPDLDLGWAIQETKRRHPELTGSHFSFAMFADVTAEHVTPTLIEQCERMRPDLVIFEGMNTGAGMAASVLEIPAAAYAIVNAEMLTAAGAARAVTNDAQRSGAIGEAGQALLGDCPERQAAIRLRDEIATMPAPAQVVPVLVELAGG